VSIKPPPRRRVTTFAIAVVAGAALTLGASNTAAGVLRGHLSGLEPELDRVDLRVRFFDSARARTALAERRFDDVLLENGDFVVRIDPNAVPAARFVEIALRPSARRYAAFRGIPPRRRLERLFDGTLVAAVHAGDSAGPPSAPSADPVPIALTIEGELE
jgi:hypothetical protein